MPPKIEIKGIRDGLLVTVGEDAWDAQRDALLAYLDAQAGFLQGARLALSIGNQPLRAAQLGHLRDEISERGLTLWAVLSDSPKTQETAQNLGLATRISRPRPERRVNTLETRLQSGEQTLLVQRTLRSGYRLENTGHIVVIGDVNPGAEIVAGGHVVVWGRLRGMVHAGAQGDENAMVCALELAPTQLRIAARLANLPRRRSSGPLCARLVNAEIIIEPWNSR
ncbi:MAG: septum site-determining protein MinC [Anaerolineales bacterium]